MPDRIVIETLELLARIGVPDAERARPQRLTARIVLEPLRGFADLQDELSNTVDYFQVARAIQALAAEKPRRLLETLAEEIAQAILAQFSVRSVELELRKYILPETAFVAANLRRERPLQP